jgi:hypothetical protein
MFRYIISSCLFLAVCFNIASARMNAEKPGRPPQQGVQPTSPRFQCSQSIAQKDLKINNVRARLLGGGDMWWDLTDGRYIVPNVQPGEKEVSSIFASAIWVGGYDGGGNLKLAAQTYRQSGNDFWPGPLDANAEITPEECRNWDRHFSAHSNEIDSLIKDYELDGIVSMNLSRELLGWPGCGNPYFSTIHGFDLPNCTSADRLAPFEDVDGDGIYDPKKGDYPVIGVIDCTVPVYGDEMIFWIYNDKGNIHTETNADQIGLEVQAVAFAYKTSDAINDMTFYKYKILNRASDDLLNAYMAQWVDPDLGCANNDFVGCNVNEELGIVYNGEATDYDCNFLGSFINGYGAQPPMLGVDFFRGPKDEFGEEIGLSAFIYYDNDFTPSGNPEIPSHYYGYLSGTTWKDGSPIEYGGDGYQEGTQPTQFMFPSDPSDSSPEAWSECSENNQPDDRRFLHSSGPFKLKVGATNEIIIGAVWTKDGVYPCPSFEPLLVADNLAQALFDNCFDRPKGPDAPDMEVVELDRQIVINLYNTPSSNNYKEQYKQKDLLAPRNETDSLYVFEGYLLYQVPKSSSSIEEGKLLAQVDTKNGVTKVFDYVLDNGVYVPTERVNGADKGITHSFTITKDLLATGDSRLINNKKYYFASVAYAFNNYKQFNPLDPFGGGQKNQFIRSDEVKNVTAIPHKIDADYGGTVLNAEQGTQLPITRIDGIGNNGYFLELTDESKDKILTDNFAKSITYKTGAGPFSVRISNPFVIQGGKYQIDIVDTTLNDEILMDSITWQIKNLDEPTKIWYGDKEMKSPDEQHIAELGIAIAIGQLQEPSPTAPNDNYGLVGGSVTYDGEEGLPWYAAYTDDIINFPFFDYINSGEDGRDLDDTYKGAISGAWVPYTLCNCGKGVPSDPTDPDSPETPYMSPAWINTTYCNNIKSQNPLRKLNNVDVVLTADKTKWSRCVVTNTFSRFHAALGLPYAPPDVEQYGIKTKPSIDKNGQADGDGTGMSWFPGYAIDVETGERLNIFFGENSMYNGSLAGFGIPTANGDDMLYNPNSDIFFQEGGFNILSFPMGGQHFVYVSRTRYDSCKVIRNNLASQSLKLRAYRDVSWVSASLLPQGAAMTSLADGLIPNNVTFKLRVNSEFAFYKAEEVATIGYPKYQFDLTGKPDYDVTEVEVGALDNIRAVPNPYNAFSAYENTKNQAAIRITNLPPKCVITIYSIDGRLIRRYNRDVVYPWSPDNRDNTFDQAITYQEWDLRSTTGVPVSSGVYLIHISAPGIGEKVIKWFGVQRKFDAQGL